MDKQKRINWLKGRIFSMEQCRDEMPFGLSEDESMELSAYKDSLASITAEYITVRPFGLPQILGEGCWVECDSCEEGATQLFTAPLVPEIKRPDLLDIPDGLDLVSAMAAINWYEMETKRLNGLGV